VSVIIYKILLNTTNVLDTIKKIREFMFEDLEKTIDLVDSFRGAPNFMLALVLCAYTEFWGKLICPGKDDKQCFDTFFCQLGAEYNEVMNHPNTNIYGRIRCGLIHEYLIKGNAEILIEGGECGIKYDVKTKKYTINIRRYFQDFRVAVDLYIVELENNSRILSNAKKAMDGGIQLR
jgi:hypothetical protein